jgi:pyruvate/2-oxoglutarate dehydrogenase complex dihydrolipoamide dehydrogenase (E3) component
VDESADVVVIGMGIGGEAVAGRLAETGLTVVGIDARLVGGECPYWGCVPSKMMIRAGNALAEARRVSALAGRATVEPDYAPVAERIRAEATDNWDDRVAVERFEAKGGRFVRGRATLDGPGRVRVTDTVFVASRGVVIAGGTAPTIPPIPGLDGLDYWTNREALEAKELPASLVVLGGGAIGLELAQGFARFGVGVTVVEAENRLLPVEEPEAGAVVADVLRQEGIGVLTGLRARFAEPDGAHMVVGLEDGELLRTERVLIATGRRADQHALGTATLGLDEGAPAIAVDDRMRVEGAERLWAVGDVTGKGEFTHVAAYQADIAAADILGEHPARADYRAVPRVTFTDPEVGSVGLSETAATAAGMRVRVGQAQTPSSARGWIHKVGNEGTIKLVEDADRGVLVGATAVGPHGGEVLGLLTLAVHAAVPTDELRRMIYAYPTFHRAVEDALRDLDG